MQQDGGLITAGLSNYLLIKKLPLPVFLPLEKSDGLWLVYFAASTEHVHLMYIREKIHSIRVLCFTFTDISIKQATIVNSILGDKQIKIIHSSGLYVHEGLLRCEIAFISRQAILANDFGHLSSRLGTECNVLEVRACESF